MITALWKSILIFKLRELFMANNNFLEHSEHKSLEYNQTLFHNMSSLVDAVWEIDPYTNTILFLHDRLTPELSGHCFSFREALIFLEAHTPVDMIDTFANILTPEFILNLDDDYVFNSTTIIHDEYHTLQCVLTPSFGKDGKVLNAYLTVQDVQMELDARHKASESQIQLDRLLSAINCGIIQYTINTKQIILANDYAVKLLGYSSIDEVKSLPFSKIISPIFEEDKKILKELINNLKLDGDPIECEFRILQKSGTVLNIFGSLRLLSQNTGEPVLQQSLIDITESQKTIHRYKEISEILEGAQMGLWYIIVGNGKPKFFVDTTTAKLLGLDPKMDPELLYSAWVQNIDFEYRTILRENMDKLAKGEKSEIVYSYNHPTKGTIDFRVGGLINKDYSGKGIMFRGYSQDITDFNKRLKEQVLREQYERETLQAMASIYSNSFLIDFENNSYDEMKAFDHIHDYVITHSQDALQSLMNDVIHDRFNGVALDHALKFVDFSTLPDRLSNTTITYIELINVYNIWVRLSFIRVGDSISSLKKVLFVTQDIDKEKRKEENLNILLNTDELTGIYNRHAYETHIEQIEIDGIGDDLWIASCDLNGLKTANDSKGHAAGDELLKATADCLSFSIGENGKAYRTGGDEFVVIFRANKDEAMQIFNKMEEFKKNWSGSFNSKFSFSMGYVCSSEMPDKSMSDIEKEADKRMYKAKQKYYTFFGDRRKKRG